MTKLLISTALALFAAGLSTTLVDARQAPAVNGTPAQPGTSQLDAGTRAVILDLLRGTGRLDRSRQLAAIDAHWSDAWVPVVPEIYNFVPDPEVRRALVARLSVATGQAFGEDMNAWYRWLWNRPEIRPQGHAEFKAEFYRDIDPRFARYFEGRGDQARVRLDEVRWGGVRQDGIPPLRGPDMLDARDADYLDDDNIVFGIEVNGDVRAYPKRILAWHEMFVDRVGGVDVAGVYCTLCGTVILYDTDGYDLGTSGFLYRSNKLMYDKATQSLWNTLTGEPVIGPLVDKGISLDHRSVVTTTWGKWRALHPDTQVLSLETGHRRDYAEGVAYHDYFADDERMFDTPFSDFRLKNKQEILALRFPGQRAKPLAVSVDYLASRPVWYGRQGEQDFVVLTDETGANRVYDPKGVTLTSFDGARSARAEDGRVFAVSESELVGPDGEVLPRLPYHRAFWFGWQGAYPNTELIK